MLSRCDTTPSSKSDLSPVDSDLSRVQLARVRGIPKVGGEQDVGAARPDIEASGGDKVRKRRTRLQERGLSPCVRPRDVGGRSIPSAVRRASFAAGSEEHDVHAMVSDERGAVDGGSVRASEIENFLGILC